MTMAAVIYHPKGSMCKVCKYRDKNCSQLNFRKMKSAMTYSQGGDPNKFVSVICTEFEKH